MGKEQSPSSTDYKSTLFLPQTDFPMRANLAQREPSFLQAWDESGVYERLMADRSDKPLFILHDGPPYANANIHIGTALNKILKDFITRYKWLRGYRAPYVPGFDTHGMPIEHKVLKEAGLAMESIDPVELRKRCESYARHFIGVQTEEFKRLGVMGAWDHPYITLEASYEAEQLRLFAEMVENGYVYKGRKAIFWCIDCQTALAAAEIEYEDETSPSIYVAYPFKEAAEKFPELAGRDVSVIIWTTTPWTLPASLAVTVHADYDYAFFEADDNKVFLIAKAMKAEVEKVTGLSLGRELLGCKGKLLERMKAVHPFYEDREILFALGDYVTLESGTGCVHTAPGHGVEDFETGIRYGLEIYNPVDAKGIFLPDTKLVGGLSLEDGAKLIFKTLAESGRLLGRVRITHSYPHCWRCKKPVIFRATDQWFVSVSAFKEKALASIDEVRWVPSWGKDRIRNMVRDRSDWCISRQRIWGVPIPAFYCEECGEIILTPDRIRAVSQKVKEEGSNTWWSSTPEQLLGDLACCPKCSSRAIRKEKDIMDVWFDSGSSHRAVLENHGEWPELRWPADMYLEGSDQHRGWFQSSLLSSVATKGTAPYKEVLTHGFIVDGEGKKMSKSLGNAILPQEIVGKYGADVLRLWVASTDYRGDIRISQTILANVAESYRRIRNTARFLLANLNGFNPARDLLPKEQLSSMDQYILIKLARVVERNTEELDDYEFHLPMSRVHQFCDNEMSSFYIDVSKDQLYADPEDSLTRKGIRSVMWEVLKGITTLIAPILCFTADEIWQEMRKMDPTLPSNAVMAQWPEASLEGLDLSAEPLWDSVLEARGAVSRALEIARSQNIIGHSLDASVWMRPSDASGLKGKLDDKLWETVSIVSSFTVVDALPVADICHEDEATGIHVAVSRNADPKCPRCWKHRAEVAQQEVCHRCKEALASER